MPKTIIVTDEVFKKLEHLRELIEKIFGKEVSINDVLRFLIEARVERFGDLVYRVMERIDVLEKEVSELKRTVGARREIAKAKHNRFVEFMKDVVVYPMDRIKVSRERVERLIYDGVLDIIYAAGKAYLVYKPKLNEFLDKLPLPLDEVKKLSKEEAKLLEILKSAALVYQDVTTKTIKKV